MCLLSTVIKLQGRGHKWLISNGSLGGFPKRFLPNYDRVHHEWRAMLPDNISATEEASS